MDTNVDDVVVHGLQYVGEDAAAPWSELPKKQGRRCMTFLSRPEVPGKLGGPGPGSPGDNWKVQGGGVPGKAGGSEGRDSAKNRDFEIEGLGGKIGGKTQILRGKRRN